MNPFKSKLWKLFTTTKYTYEKEVISAVVTTNVLFRTKKKRAQAGYTLSMYLYAALIFVAVAASLMMLALSKETQQKYTLPISIVESLVFVVLLADTLLRWYSSEVRIRKGNLSYFLWPITITGLILLASLLPSLYLIDLWTGKNIPFFERMEQFKFLRIFRMVLLANLVPGIAVFKRAIAKEKRTLFMVFGVVVVAIVLFALVIYNIESDNSKEALKQLALNHGWQDDGKTTYQQFLADPANADVHLGIRSFLDALYFSTVSLTTIGFGDITPITHMGKIVVIVMSIIGIAVLAIPAGVITGGFIQEIKTVKKEKEEQKLSSKKDKA